MGLRPGDLKDMVKNIFEVDSFASKMGDDADIVVVSFSVNEEQAANDLVDFIEKGYNFVLDADATAGEVDNNIYKVFVEIERDRNINDNIMELLDGVGKLSLVETFKFRYHKSFTSRAADLGTLSEMIPIDPDSYEITMQENKDNVDTFFNKSMFEKVDMIDKFLLLKKSFADPIGFEIKKFGKSNDIIESIDAKIDVNSYPEIMFLTKYLGEYNITKFSDKTLTLENNGHTLVLERL